MYDINIVTLLLVFCIFTNIGWFILCIRTNREWYKLLLELNDSWGNYYEKIIKNLANGEEEKDERNNVL